MLRDVLRHIGYTTPYERDADLAVRWGTPFESASAFTRLRRDGVLDGEGEETARSLLAVLETEIT